MRLLPIAEAIALEGKPLSGASPSEAEIIQKLVKDTCKGICAVTAWVIIDVLDVDLSPIIASGKQPFVMFTYSVLLHRTGEYQQGERVKTGYAVSYGFSLCGNVYLDINGRFKNGRLLRISNLARFSFASGYSIEHTIAGSSYVVVGNRGQLFGETLH